MFCSLLKRLGLVNGSPLHIYTLFILLPQLIRQERDQRDGLGTLECWPDSACVFLVMTSICVQLQTIFDLCIPKRDFRNFVFCREVQYLMLSFSCHYCELHMNYEKELWNKSSNLMEEIDISNLNNKDASWICYFFFLNIYLGIRSDFGLFLFGIM